MHSFLVFRDFMRGFYLSNPSFSDLLKGESSKGEGYYLIIKGVFVDVGLTGFELLDFFIIILSIIILKIFYKNFL